MDHRSTMRSFIPDPSRRVLMVYISILIFSFIDMIHRFLLFTMGYRSRRDDVTQVYFPMARGVLGGGDLYIVQWDNRPPLFQFLNIGVGATGEYMLVFYLLLAVANTVTAYLIYRLTSKHYLENVGLLAAILYIFALPIAGGVVIGARPFANILLLASLIVTSPMTIGLFLAAAALFHQYAILATPAVLLYHHIFNTKNIDVMWLGRFTVAGLITVSLSYAFVAVIWGSDSLIAGIRYTVLGAGEYVTQERPHSIISNPVIWLGNEWETVRTQSLYYIFSGVAIYAWYRRRSGRNPKHDDVDYSVPVFVVAVVALSLPRLIRNAQLYRLLPLPFVMILSAVGLMLFFRN